MPGPLKGLAERFDDSPIDSPEKAQHFIRTRSSYVAQTALYGYLKTRMGTRYRQLFEDKTFSRSIRIAASQTFASCLSDMTIYGVAMVARDGGLADDEARLLAERIYVSAYKSGLEKVDRKEQPEGARERFQVRLDGIHWKTAAETIDVFESSSADLIRFAPVIDEFKELDGEIVNNSLWLRWIDIRKQWEKRLRAGDVATAWRGGRAA
ncbi:MAG: hypothetical protein VW268_11870 [Rhodospirillaceae bacterium]